MFSGTACRTITVTNCGSVALRRERIVLLSPTVDLQGGIGAFAAERHVFIHAHAEFACAVRRACCKRCERLLRAVHGISVAVADALMMNGRALRVMRRPPERA